MKKLFHSRFLDMRLVIAKLAPRASLAINHLNSCELKNAPRESVQAYRQLVNLHIREMLMSVNQCKED